jgi:hypothetical protein
MLTVAAKAHWHTARWPWNTTTSIEWLWLHKLLKRSIDLIRDFKRFIIGPFFLRHFSMVQKALATAGDIKQKRPRAC